MEWCTDFCLSCDQQTNGSAYCSQACRMADLDRVNTSGSSSLESTSPLSLSSSSTSPVRSSFYLPPAIDFSAYRSSPVTFSRESSRITAAQRGSLQRSQTSPSSTNVSSQGQLKTSSSGMSLSSVHQLPNTSRTSLSQQSKYDLSAYANAFDEVRLLKRRKSLY